MPPLSRGAHVPGRPRHPALGGRRQGLPGRHHRQREDGGTWVHSYVTPDRKQTYCVYDAPAPEAIRRVAERNKLPVDRIAEVRVLDPYFYR